MQPNENLPFIEEILNNISSIICDLQPHQVCCVCYVCVCMCLWVGIWVCVCAHMCDVCMCVFACVCCFYINMIFAIGAHIL